MLSLLYWVVGGAAAGWLMGKLMSGEGRDHVMDLVMGVAGAIGGSFLFSTMRLLVEGKMVYTMLAAIMGAVVLTMLARYMGERREYGATD
ncbi:MAG TPA: GlsB/YeaQ/YmgE family stress response membrane protein [Candidatus Dormibacteraeota bacterium]|nr:GlsB/YeaQ/YmgE family stress response membrane protein [Candidatus Dormibacteraeota bacterium]